MRRSGSPGNVTVLVVYQSLLVLLVAIFGLDVFVVLYVRITVQTAADSAALGAVRAVQNELGPLLWKQADQKVQAWLEEAAVRWEQAVDDWEKAYADAGEECMAEHTDELGEVDEDGAAQCVGEWRDAHRKPQLVEVEQQTLDEYVGDAEVVEALLGLRRDVEMERIINAVVPSAEQVCVVDENQRVLSRLAQIEARNYAEFNGAELVTATVPYDGKAQVYVKVEREIPTVVLSRLGGESLTAVGETAATLLSLVTKEVGVVEC